MLFKVSSIVAPALVPTPAKKKINPVEEDEEEKTGLMFDEIGALQPAYSFELESEQSQTSEDYSDEYPKSYEEISSSNNNSKKKTSWRDRLD